MGKVSDLLNSRINQIVSAVGIVVWYDSENYYSELVTSLSDTGLKLLEYKDSFFALRAQIETFIDQSEAPKMLVYVPLKQEETQHALIEVEVAGAVIKPGAVPPTYNTRPSHIARQALQPIVGDEVAQAIEKQVEEGKLSLADLESIAEQGSGLSKGVVSLVFGIGSPQEVALAFLSSDQYDAELQTKEAMPELAALLQAVYEYQPPVGKLAADHRKSLARFIIVSDLLYHLPEPLPAALISVAAATKPANREACAGLAQTWRNRRDICNSYRRWAGLIESEIHLKDLVFTRQQLSQVETFLDLEKRLVELFTTEFIEGAEESLVAFAEEHQSTFWPEQCTELQTQWALIASAGRVLLQGRRIEKALKASPNCTATELTKSYVQEDEPWCLLDTYHRNMERRIHNFEFDATGTHQSLEQLIAKAREWYTKTGSLLAERFVRAYAKGKFEISGLQKQRAVFETQYKISLLGGKAAFVWVDALRFEMGRELADILVGEFDVIIQPAVASVPTLTEIGMASLLPLPKNNPILFSPSESKLAIDIQGNQIKDRKDRIAYLRTQTFLRMVDLHLEELLPNPKKAIRDAIKRADLVLVTSQEIDELCEGDNVHLARRIMDDMLLELRRAFRILRDLGVKTIVCTADHGYLFGEEVGVDMKIDPPGGQTVDLHRRVWVGQGGAADASYLRAPLQDFGWKTDLEIAVPWNFACFKVKGGTRAYFHGGISPQELFIPVLTIRSLKKAAADIGSYTWKITPGTPKISTRFYSVQIAGEVTGLFEAKPPKVHIEVRSKNDSISMPISASYGFSDATGDVQMRAIQEDPRKVEPNTITLMITKDSSEKKSVVSVVLLETETGVELIRLDEIEMGFSI
ncbi:MAG: PglZ domain-containing protein [Anaerolineaceae bacterium]|nr:PglZ domain-containing protein [Anaerolineaceae bacterium]